MKALTIGRSSENNISVNDPGVSRYHCRLTQYDDGSVTITDVGSTNGTFVNGIRILGETQLYPGDQVNIFQVPFSWEAYVQPTMHRNSVVEPQESHTGLLIGLLVAIVALILVLVLIFATAGSYNSSGRSKKKSHKTELSEKTVSIPYREENGVKVLSCTINGEIVTDMIFDTGCSGATISIKEAKYLYRRGLLSDRDYKGNMTMQIANDNIVEAMVFNIKSLVIADKVECNDVEVTVVNNPRAPLLLGNEVLNRLPRYTVDQENHQIVFHLE
ncbi:MAG: FHA domain-containing protein [Bacteroidales bacterium]|nr:FHA domain-containing protein [Bacteroidales bacterium]